MNEALDKVTEWLLRASSEVGPHYFQLPVAGKEEPGYRERVYCYELYHRWRTHWPDTFRFSLSGEIDKAGHRLIRNGTKPDFLVHIPGQMMNLLIVEVKPENADEKQMVEDLAKLTSFRRDLGERHNYKAAYFWIYGRDENGWQELRRRLQEKIAARTDIDLQLIVCHLHAAPGEQAFRVKW
jgi:hypothetical protein